MNRILEAEEIEEIGEIGETGEETIVKINLRVEEVIEEIEVIKLMIAEKQKKIKTIKEEIEVTEAIEVTEEGMVDRMISNKVETSGKSPMKASKHRCYYSYNNDNKDYRGRGGFTRGSGRERGGFN
eukprot:GHVR01088916.1.p3 GENE.GHVR01088916.1~~GHVR01088916.1.p3  ORF type:complete len:126 (+),score=22.62 GHVR01088916.1:2987-3364(+)